MTEALLYEHVAHYLRTKYPEAVFHYDLGGVHNPSHRTRNLYSRLNGRAYPDLFVAAVAEVREASDTGTEARALYAGLFLELKVERTRLRKKDGSWATPHIAEQAEMLARLVDRHYVAQFACGLDEACRTIDSYMEAAV